MKNCCPRCWQKNHCTHHHSSVLDIHRELSRLTPLISGPCTVLPFPISYKLGEGRDLPVLFSLHCQGSAQYMAHSRCSGSNCWMKPKGMNVSFSLPLPSSLKCGERLWCKWKERHWKQGECWNAHRNALPCGRGGALKKAALCSQLPASERFCSCRVIRPFSLTMTDGAARHLKRQGHQYEFLPSRRPFQSLWSFGNEGRARNGKV